MDALKTQQTDKRRAFEIGFVCIMSYLVSYFLRKMLGVATPLILEEGVYTKTAIAGFSSIYMVFYASGQLINGIIGDYVNPRKMSLTGLLVSSMAIILFPITDFVWMAWICFALLGFGLSMLRGPFMKIISENTTPNHARMICVFFSCASFIGPFIASFLMMLFSWRWAFYVAGGLSLAISLFAFISLTSMEKRGIINFRKHTGTKVSVREILSVFKIQDFVFYMIIGGVAEISSTTISFWLPTYFSEHLGQSVNFANTSFSVISFLLGLCPFVTLFLFHRSHERTLPMMRIMLASASVSFLVLLFVKQLWVNYALVFVGMFAIGCVSSLLWSIYIPGLGKTGRVSSVNGVLDCSGYLFAALANVIFTALMENTGWDGMVLGWLVVAILGLIITIFKREKRTA